ncbi:hypothetical protein BRO54_3805 [Geobacillus proteiniphilus]|uniref:Uncharacterized protein n=1 Tax=Geobacillus proteiniphilus TaxID=860353 RepID=A0A1Q5SI88_9BACL|nr:hypothetical protein BRO54_3805 [Geobacillus proteiniphilus]
MAMTGCHFFRIIQEENGSFLSRSRICKKEQSCELATEK